MRPWKTIIRPIYLSFKQALLTMVCRLLSLSMTRLFVLCRSWHCGDRVGQSGKPLEAIMKTIRHCKWEQICNCAIVMNMCLLCTKRKRNRQTIHSFGSVSDHFMEVEAIARDLSNNPSSFLKDTFEKLQKIDGGISEGVCSVYCDREEDVESDFEQRARSPSTKSIEAIDKIMISAQLTYWRYRREDPCMHSKATCITGLEAGMSGIFAGSGWIAQEDDIHFVEQWRVVQWL